jgi:hypothetical protein
MALKLLSKSVSNAKKLINAGKINRGEWGFSAADGNKLLGKAEDWDAYALWHLVEDDAEPEETKDRYKYPYGKDGEVYTKALSSAEGYATKEGADAVAKKAKALFDLCSDDDDKKKEPDDKKVKGEEEGKDGFTVDPKGKTFEDCKIGMNDEEQTELEHVLREVSSGKIDPANIALELPEEEQEEIDDDDDCHAIRALAKVRAANKEKFQGGDKDGYDLRNGGKGVKRETFLKAIGGKPENWKKKNQPDDDKHGSNTEPPEGEPKKPEPGTAKTGTLPDSKEAEGPGASGSLESKRPGAKGSATNAAGDRRDGSKTLLKQPHTDRITSMDWLTKTFQRTPEGYLSGRAIVTNVGVFNYADATGATRRELRLPEEVFNPDSVSSLKLKPVTNDHPTEDVNAANFKEYVVGHLGNNPGDDTQNKTWDGWNDSDEMTDGLHLPIDMVIEDATTVDDVLAGKTALSCGYTCDLEPADPDAMYLGQPYDFIQRNIRYNHVAIVDKARAGDAARIRLDSADFAFVGKTPRRDGFMVKKITLDGVQYEAEEAVINELLRARKDAADAVAKAKTEADEKARLAAERDTLKTNLDGNSDKVAAAVQARVKVLDGARLVKVDTQKDGKDLPDAEIKKAVILKVFPQRKLDGQSDAYIDASFDLAIEQIQTRNDGMTRGMIAGGAMALAGGVVAAGIENRIDADYEGEKDPHRDAMIRDMKKRSRSPVGIRRDNIGEAATYAEAASAASR